MEEETVKVEEPTSTPDNEFHEVLDHLLSESEHSDLDEKPHTHDIIEGSSLRSPLEIILLHDYLSKEFSEISDRSEDELAKVLSECLCHIRRENECFLKDRYHYNGDMAILKYLLKQFIPESVDLNSLISKALFDPYGSPEVLKSSGYDRALKEALE